MSEAREPNADAEHRLSLGDEYPYCDHKPIGWQYRAANGVLADLQDRRGIKYPFNEVDQDVRNEIVDSLGAIILSALVPSHTDELVRLARCALEYKDNGYVAGDGGGEWIEQLRQALAKSPNPPEVK